MKKTQNVLLLTLSLANLRTLRTCLMISFLSWYFIPFTVLCACLCASGFHHVQLFATPWTVACQGPLSMGFSRQEYWSGLPCPPPLCEDHIYLFEKYKLINLRLLLPLK